MAPGNVFVDESKARDYLLIASVVLPIDVTAARKDVRALVLSGQRRIHMKSESDTRRRVILTAFEEHGFTATIYRAGTTYKTDLDRRAACLKQLVDDIAACGHSTLCLESDESLNKQDRRHLARMVRAAGCPDLHYLHDRAAQEPLLAIPDAIGWAWARGGTWRRRVRPLVLDVIDV